MFIQNTLYQTGRPLKVLSVIYAGYQKGSLMLTSNRSLEEWMALFGDPIQANSLLDRLCHNAHQLEWEGESYRRRKRPAKGSPQKEVSP